jgi:uncharacterized phage protein (TIGR01671 family)
MNREIKFRVWDKAENEFSELEEYRNSDEWFNTIYPAKIPDSLVIQQFTGLKDKNGKEIYEGDIVKVKSKRFEFQEPLVYNEKIAGFGFKDGNDYIGLYIQDSEFEIVGNVFENLELCN